MAISASNKKVQLAAVLCLALVMAASTSALAAEQQECTVPTEVDACVDQIREELDKATVAEPFLTPSCCKELRRQIGCGCLLRDAVLLAGLDIGAPFCAAGTGCK